MAEKLPTISHRLTIHNPRTGLYSIEYTAIMNNKHKLTSP